MIQTLLTVLEISVIIAIPSSMFLLAMEAGRPYLTELLGKPKILAKYFLVMYVLMPAIALLFYFIDAIHHSLWIAVLVISLSPPSPAMIKGIDKLGGDTNLSVAWMIIAIFISFIMIPLNLLIIEQILNVDINIGMGALIIKLLILFIIPMTIGFVIHKYFPNVVPAALKIIGLISKIAMIVLIVCLLIIAVPMMFQKNIIDLLLILLFLIISLAISHFTERSDNENNGPILSYSVVSRLPAPALVLAGLNGMTKTYAPDILSFLILGVILMAVYNKFFYGKVKSVF
ncbi:MAG TPA: hypothetical protein PKD83_04750 [Ignavibacteria bacterium]|nr:hypothetical protein [Ignavibacteria bacterium]